MKAFKIFSILAVSALAVSCGNNNNTNTEVTAELLDSTQCAAENCIVGRWVQPIPGQESKVEGIELKQDGTAESINMATLVVEKWSQDSTTLTLSGKSIGNGVTSDFTETYTVAQGDKNSLTLIQNGSIIWSFTKEGGCCSGDSCSDCGDNCEHEHSGNDGHAVAGQPEEEGCSGCGACGK